MAKAERAAALIMPRYCSPQRRRERRGSAERVSGGAFLLLSAKSPRSQRLCGERRPSVLWKNYWPPT